MTPFRLQIVTPLGTSFDGEAEAIHLRTTEGYVSIRAHHADYIAAVDIGVITLTRDGKERKAACGGGFLSVEKGQVRLVAVTFEYGDEIDIDRALQSKQWAEDRLAASKEPKELELAKSKLERALTRLKAAEYKALS